MVYNTNIAKLKKLEEFLLSFLVLNSRDFTPKLDITLTTIIDKSTLLLEMKLEHRGNWSNTQRMKQRRSKFMHALKDGMSEFEIEVAGGVDVNVIDFNGTSLSGIMPRPVEKKINEKSTTESFIKLAFE